MKLISVYVTVGAISFVKCEVRHDSVTPFQSALLSQIYKGEWGVKKYENKSEADLGEDLDVETKSGVDVEELSERRKDFFQVFGQIKDIYVQCKTKVDRSVKDLMKDEVKSRLSELKAYVLTMYRCIKVLSVRALDRTLSDHFIPVTEYAYFVRDGGNATEDPSSARSRPVPLKDYAARVLGRDWTALVGEWFENLLRTHSLKFQLDNGLVSQGRGRRRDHRMFAMMVMGFMIMASILIPMGFQFLTVLGGKSLLLAKMALIMSAINGLKKIATSNVGYGFYHTGSDGHHHDHVHHGFHEKHYHVNPQNYNHLQGYN